MEAKNAKDSKKNIWDSRYSVLDLQGLIELNQTKIQITTDMFRLS